MQDTKRFVVNLTAKSFSLALNLVISFFLTPYIIRHVGTESYGFVGLANDFVDVARIAAVALNSMALRFIAVSLHRGDNDRANRYFSSVMILNIFLAGILILPFGGIVICLDKLFSISTSILSDIRLLWIFIFLNFMLSVAGSGYSVALFAKNRIDKESFRSAESVLLRAVFLWICYTAFAPKTYYVGISYCILTVYVLITNIYYTRKYLPELTVSFRYFDKKSVKTLFASGSWNCLTKVATILSTGLDLLLLNLFVGSREMGLVAISKTMPNTVLSVFVILSGVFLPRLTEHYSKENTKEMTQNAVFSIKLLGLLAVIPLTLLGVFGDTFYALWTPTENAGYLWMLSVLGGGAFILSLATQNLWNLFTVTNRVKISSLGLLASACASILTVLISMIFIKDPAVRIWIIVGCSAGFTLLLTATFLPMQAAKCLSLPKKTFYLPMLKTVLLFSVSFAVFFGVKHIFPLTGWGSFIAVFAAICFTVPLLGFFLLWNKTERKHMIRLILRKSE